MKIIKELKSIKISKLKLFAAGMVLLPNLGWAGVTELISNNITSNSSFGEMRSISEDGRYVILYTGSNMFGYYRVMYDRVTKETDKITIDDEGNSISTVLTYGMSHDARSVGFIGWKSGGGRHLFVRNYNNRSTEIASIDQDGNPVTVDNYNMQISGDGRFVAYLSSDGNIVPDDTNNLTDLFVYDRELGITERINVSSDGHQSMLDADISVRAISEGGRYVLFSSKDSDLVEGDTNGFYDAYLRDRELGITKRISVGPNGEQFDKNISLWNASDDGRYILCSASAPFSVMDSEFYLYDNQTGITSMLTDVEGTVIRGKSLSISGDGRYVSFTSSERLVAEDVDYYPDAYRYEIATQSLKLASVKTSEEQVIGQVSNTSISRDGRHMVFEASGINGYSVFVHEFDLYESVLHISPGSGTYVTNQQIDLVLVLENPGEKAIESAQLTWNDEDISEAFKGCATQGLITPAGTTWRCADLTVGGILAIGNNKISARVTFSDGSEANASVNWRVFGNTEQ